MGCLMCSGSVQGPGVSSSAFEELTVPMSTVNGAKRRAIVARGWPSWEK